MHLTRTLLLSVLLAIFLVGCANQQPATPTAGNADAFAIQNVTVIDVKTGEKAADQTVLVRGNQIAEVGAAAQIQVPAGVRVVNGQGRFLIPGIWDMHVHAMRAPDRALPLLVA